MSINLQTQHKLTLDFQQKTYKTVIAKQYDKGSRFIPIECTDNGKTVLLDSSFDVHVKVLTPDNRALLNTVPVQENGTLLLELTETMLSCPGKAIVEIIIYDISNSKRLSAMNFYLLIEPGAYADDRILSSDEFNALTELLEKADSDYTDIVTAAKESADAAKESSDAAKISETNAKASEMNAKTSETNAALSESNAAASAAVSENSVKLSESWAVGGTNSRTDEDTDNSKYYAVLSSTSAANSQNCMEQAAISATDAKTSELNAGNSAANAASSENNAKTSEINSKTSETNAKNSEINAANSDSSASASATTASTKAEEAAENATIASSKAEESADSAKYANTQAVLTESYFHGGTGTREGEDEDCVTAYYEKIKSVADIDIASTKKAGLVRASDDINVGIDGSMSVPKLAELESIMKGASSGFVTDTVQSMVTMLNDASLADYKIGTNILIKAVGVPDFWISEIYSEKITYTYTDDDNLIEQVNLNGGTLQTGYYGISFLETDKVDLTNYATKDYVNAKSNEIKSYTDTQISGVDKNSIGLGNVENVSVNNQSPTFSQAGTLANIANGEKNSVLWGKVSKAIAELISHISNTTMHITSAERTAWNAKQNAATAITTSNIGKQSVNYAASAGSSSSCTGNSATATTSTNANKLNISGVGYSNQWAWSGQSGQPSWLWGSNDGRNMYVWNPSNFNVNYASSAGNADTLDGYHASSFATTTTTNNLQNQINSLSGSNVKQQSGTLGSGGGSPLTFTVSFNAGFTTIPCVTFWSNATNNNYDYQILAISNSSIQVRVKRSSGSGSSSNTFYYSAVGK